MLSSKLTLSDIPRASLAGKRILVRVDFNVPIKEGRVTDATRIRAALPTIQYLRESNVGRIVLISHCGRPDGRSVAKYSLRPVVSELSTLLSAPVDFVEDYSALPATSASGSVILLENLRFHVEEEGKGVNEEGALIKANADNVTSFRSALTSLGDIFINDAFGTAHRGHASMVGVNLPIRAAGFLMQKELAYFAKVLENPQRPVLAILGGAKIKDKIPLIKKLLSLVNSLIIGGGMAYTFLRVLNNMKIGNSLFDEEGSQIVHDLINEAKERNIKILLPVDFVCGDKFSEDANIRTSTVSEGVPDGFMGLDCGPETVAAARKLILESKTIIWNGPQGVFEMAPFKKGSLGFLDAVAEATRNGATTIVGGGDTAALVEGEHRAHEISHVSTGGGASLELLEGKQLPGVVALSDKQAQQL